MDNLAIEKKDLIVKLIDFAIYYFNFINLPHYFSLKIQNQIQNLIKEALTRGKIVKDNLSTEDMVMVYWMIEFATLQQNVKK